MVVFELKDVKYVYKTKYREVEALKGVSCSFEEGRVYAVLTDLIHREWSGLHVKEHKQLKGLKDQNLRDHMSEAELILTALAELSTRLPKPETPPASGRMPGQVAGVAP